MNVQARTLETDRLLRQNPIQKLKGKIDSVSFTLPPTSSVMFLFAALFHKEKEKRLKKQETEPKSHIENSFFPQVAAAFHQRLH